MMTDEWVGGGGGGVKYLTFGVLIKFHKFWKHFNNEIFY
jgi:hypothetical protein